MIVNFYVSDHISINIWWWIIYTKVKQMPKQRKQNKEEGLFGFGNGGGGVGWGDGGWMYELRMIESLRWVQVKIQQLELVEETN